MNEGTDRRRWRRASQLAPRRSAKTEVQRELLDLVLEAATQTIVRHGWDAASMQGIARRAGVSTGFVYRYFSNREAVGRALLVRAWEEERAALECAAAAPTASLESLHATYCDVVAREPRLYAALPALTPLGEERAGWDAERLAILVRVFDAQFEDDPRKQQACDLTYAACTSVALRAARTCPDALTSGAIKSEILGMVTAYLATFTRRTRISLATCA